MTMAPNPLRSSANFAVTEVRVPGQQTWGGTVFPLVLGCQTPDASLDQALAWVQSVRDDLGEKAARHGAILFRGFPTRTDLDFDAFIRAFDWPNFKYEDSLSNAVRTVRTERVFTANEAPAQVTIYLHHEMAQTPVYPSKLFFFCEKAADAGGATPLCRSDVLFERLLEHCPDFARNCERKGLRYRNVMPATDDPQSGMGRSWQKTFRVQSRAEAEQAMERLGYSYRWLEDGCLEATTPVLQGARRLADGRLSFFNQLIAAFEGWKDARNDPSKSITFGDGSALNPEDAHLTARLAEEITFDLLWQTGDVALVDNFVAMHGRRTFAGTRRVLASLVAA